MKKYLVFLNTFFVFLPSVAWALPEAARYGHFTCTTCHVSPAGGGTLTSYGRDFSATKLSTWSYTNEENPLEGALPISDMFLIGGDARWVNLQQKTGDQTFKKFWRMQTDLELGAHVGPGWLTYAVGTEPAGPLTSASEAAKIKTRGFMGRVDLWDDHIIVRAGLFMPKFGLMLSDHTAFVRMATGLMPDTEQTQAEVTYQDDNFEATVAALFQSSMLDREDKSKSGFSLGLAGFYQKHRINFNVIQTKFSQETSDTTMTALSLSGIITFTKMLYGMFEFDRVKTLVESSGSEKNLEALANYFSLNVELYRGIIPFARYEFWDTDITKKNTSTGRWGGGMTWYPRPHFQIEARMTRSIANKSITTSDESDVILHYYF